MTGSSMTGSSMTGSSMTGSSMTGSSMTGSSMAGSLITDSVNCCFLIIGAISRLLASNLRRKYKPVPSSSPTARAAKKISNTCHHSIPMFPFTYIG